MTGCIARTNLQSFAAGVSFKRFQHQSKWECVGIMLISRGAIVCECYF